MFINLELCANFNTSKIDKKKKKQNSNPKAWQKTSENYIPLWWLLFSSQICRYILMVVLGRINSFFFVKLKMFEEVGGLQIFNFFLAYKYQCSEPRKKWIMRWDRTDSEYIFKNILYIIGKNTTQSALTGNI